MKELIEKYFAKRDDVAFAFLFGSQADGRATARSDVDVAVYFMPETRHPLEFEEDVRYAAEDEVLSELGCILGKDVELLVLNRAPADVAASALGGIPVCVRDWGLYLDFDAIASRVAIDVREELVRDFKEKHGLEDRDHSQVD